MNNGKNMATDNDALLENLNTFKIENAKSMGVMSADIRVLSSEVRQLNDGLAANVAIAATKTELAEAKAAADIVHENQNKRISDIESDIRKVVWLVISVVILAVLAEVFKSNLNIGA